MTRTYCQHCAGVLWPHGTKKHICGKAEDEPKRRCSYDPATRILKIVMTPKRGKKIVEKIETYEVEPFATDDTVAKYAFQLTKQSDGKIYELGVREFGPECNCPHHTFHPNGGPCKHILAMRAAQLLPE